jgi:hypothetical protein
MVITKDVKAYLSYEKKLFVLKSAQKYGSVRSMLKTFNIPRSTYYKWKKAFTLGGEAALLRKHPVASSHPSIIKPEVIELVLKMRKEQQLGPGGSRGT